ncbi:MAG: hypothetical protein ACRDRO_18235 [Pseudonocardiaceae bacterium]
MQPGKIEHDIRHGELAALHLVPHTPYYGTHEATPLYVLVAAMAWAWHGDRAELDRLRPHVQRALEWIDTDGDFDGDGLQEYQTRSPRSYYNQGWKDAGDAIVGSDHYGLDAEAAQVARALFDVADRFASRRLPELFAGLPRDPAGFPVQYLGANVPQAWASGAVIHLITVLLGLKPDASAQHLQLRPALPDWLPEIRLEQLTIGDTSVDLTVSRLEDGTHHIDAEHRRRKLDITLDDTTTTMAGRDGIPIPQPS